MGIRYVAFDVETPNHMNNRISSIGISAVSDEGVVTTKEYLVNPECEFDAFNISLTGITPDMARSAPSFPYVWAEIEPLFTDNLIVAHNALFDLNVLQKTLLAYNLSAPTLRYLCTMKMARSVLPQLNNYKLPTLCEHYGIELNHHDAGSDSAACANIIMEFKAAGIQVEHYASLFDCRLLSQPKHAAGNRQAPSMCTRALNELGMILKTIACDGILTNEEIKYLIQWMKDNSFLRGNYPYDRIYNKLAEVLEDGIITQQEHSELLQLFRAADDPLETVACKCNCLDITGKAICLSGDFDFGKKEDVSAILVERGATVQQSVTKKTNILIVGGQGSSAWSSGNYGSKIKKALELRAKGIEIIIIREADFLKSIGV